MKQLSNSDRCFVFDPPTGDVSTGRFFLHEPTLRSAFQHVSNLGLFGCRYLRSDGSSIDLPFMDPRRRAFLEMCNRYGHGQQDLRAFRGLLEPRSGMVVNSLQSPKARGPHGFNDLARMFIENVGGAGGYAEELDLVLFFGTYDSGFGLHKDASDTMMFVLDGRKNFLVECDDCRQQYSLEAGHYLRWTSTHAHTNSNPTGDWSMTLNFGLGFAASKHVAPGTAVEYIHERVTLKDFEEFILASNSKLPRKQSSAISKRS